MILGIIITFKEIFYMLVKFISYLFYLPAYIFICPIYSFCRLNDFSWGTKGLTNETFTD